MGRLLIGLCMHASSDVRSTPLKYVVVAEIASDRQSLQTPTLTQHLGSKSKCIDADGRTRFGFTLSCYQPVANVARSFIQASFTFDMSTEMFAKTPMEVAVYQLHNFSISFFSSLLGGDVVSVKLDNR